MNRKRRTRRKPDALQPMDFPAPDIGMIVADEMMVERWAEEERRKALKQHGDGDSSSISGEEKF